MNLRLLLSALLLPVLASCQTPAPAIVSNAPLPELRAEYLALAKTGPVYAVDAAASKVRIHVFRAGAAAKLGHNHVLSAPKFEGYVSVPTAQAADAKFELRVPLDELLVDEPQARREVGDGFSGERSAEDIDGTRRNMLGERGFQSDRFPTGRLRSLAIEGDWPILLAQVEITLHGVTRTQPLMLNVHRDAAQVKVEGTLILRQSDFGMTPFSAMGGLMKVQDAVAIAFSLVASAVAN